MEFIFFKLQLLYRRKGKKRGPLVQEQACFELDWVDNVVQPCTFSEKFEGGELIQTNPRIEHNECRVQLDVDGLKNCILPWQTGLSWALPLVSAFEDIL